MLTPLTTDASKLETICDHSKAKPMTTDQLITLLAADLKPVDLRRILWAVIVALVIGTAAAFGVMLLIFGSRPEMPGLSNPDLLVIKLLFAFAVVMTGAKVLPRMARPGTETRSFPALIFTPFVAIAAAAVVVLGSAHFSSWIGMIVGKDSLTCLLSIPLLAILPFTALTWALTIGAPTDRTRAGEIAGLVAGGLGALACAFPCADGSLPSIALWYSLPIGICATFGAMLGPRLLRW